MHASRWQNCTMLAVKWAIQRNLAWFSRSKLALTAHTAAICNKSQPLGATEPGSRRVTIPHPFIFCLSFILPPSTSTAALLPSSPSTDAVIHHADTSEERMEKKKMKKKKTGTLSTVGERRAMKDESHQGSDGHRPGRWTPALLRRCGT